MNQAAIEQKAEHRTDAVSRTMMFTDIEASTALLQALGDEYPAVLRRHQDIVRECYAPFGGDEDGTQGDSFLVLFDTPRQALGAAIEIQRRLKTEQWPRGIDLRVRIGLHEGPIQQLGKQLVGYDLHLAARIGDTGHGGQIVLSRNVYQLLEQDDFAAWDVKVRPLGVHRLKAIRYPETLFDIVDPQICIDFPPLRTLDVRRTNITQPCGPIVGRDRETSEIMGLLNDSSDRLVTVTGMGGTGKTTLAQRVAALWLRDTEDGAYFVDFSGLDTPGLVLPSIAQALGVRDYPGRPISLDIASFIGTSRMLLVLDTFEHVIDAAVAVSDLLDDCPNLRLLVTSRAELRVRMEKIYAIDPLSLPKASDPTPETSGAMRLFVEAVQAETSDFQITADNRATVAKIVTRLEGIPLALNLAAARMSLLSPQQLLERLDKKLKLLRSSQQDSGRHRTLRNAIEWSESLLNEEERQTFLALSVFSGGFRIDDAEDTLLEISDFDADVLEAVASLTSKNLLYRRVANGAPRFGMFDMVREFATELLEKNGDLEQAQTAFIDQFARLCKTCGAYVLTHEQKRHVTRLSDEADNIRAALRIALGRQDIETCARFIDALYWYWISQGQFTESLDWIKKTDELASKLGDSAAAAKINLAAAYTKAMAGDYEGAYLHGQKAERIFTELNDEDATKKAAMIHAICGAATGNIEDPSETIMGCIQHMQAKGDNYFTALGLLIMGEGARMEGMKDAAEECYGQALELLTLERNTFWPGLLKQNVAHFRIAEGKTDEALALLGEAFDLGRDFDYPPVINLCVAAYGGVAMKHGNAEKAARLLGAVEANMAKIGAKFEPTDKADIDGYIAQAVEALGREKYDEYAKAGAATPWVNIREEARSSGNDG